jgi:hypothetical protein
VTVADVNPDAVDRNHDFFAQFGLTRWIGVAKHRFDGRDQSKLVQDFGATHISGVKNELDSRQRLVDSGPKKSVRIGDESHNVRFGV